MIAFSSSGVKVLVALPLFTTSANDICFLDFGCTIMESRTTSSGAGTPIAAAAPSVSAMRPAAPARLMASKFIMVDQLPPVICAPRTGSLNFGSLEASDTRMSLHFAPIAFRRRGKCNLEAVEKPPSHPLVVRRANGAGAATGHNSEHT